MENSKSKIHFLSSIFKLPRCPIISLLAVILFIQCKPLTLSKKNKVPKPQDKKDVLRKEIAELEKKVVEREKDAEQRKTGATEEKTRKPEEILKELEKEMLEKEQVSKFLSDKYYQMGKELYNSRELENAKSALLKSLEYDPSNTQAKTLLEDIKLELGEVTPGDIGTIARAETQRILAQIQGARFEVIKLYQEAIDNFKEKKYQDAKLKFKKVIETLKWFPYELKLQDIEKKSKEYLKQIEKEIKKEKFISEKKLQEKAQEEAKNIEEKEKAYTQKQLQQLIKEALYHLKAKNFIKAKELVKQAQEIAPFNRKIQQLSAKIDEAEYAYKNKELETIQEEEEAKRKIMEESKTIIPPEEFNFPSKEVWAEIKKRKPDIPIIQAKEESIFEREVITNLRKLSVEAYTISNLETVITPLRTFAEDQGIKINFNYVGTKNLDEIKLPSQYTFPGGTGEDFIRELKRVFTNLIIKIVPGGILFMDKSPKIIKEEFITKLYNVRDIIEPINTLSKTPRIPAVGAEEEFQVDSLPGIAPDALVTLICKEIKEFISTGQEGEEGATPLDCSNPNDDKVKEFFNKENAENLGVISVTAPEEAHLIVREILKKVRHFSSILVSVETRFLLVTEDFIQDIGIDMRGLNADDFDNAVLLSSFPNPPFSFFSKDVAKIVPTSQGQPPIPPVIKDQPSAGIFRQSHDLRARLENIMADDQVVRTLFRNILEPAGGLTAQYTLLGNTQIRAILRAVERDRRIKTLLGQNIIAHNGERVYFRNINKLKYVKKLQDAGAIPGQPLLTLETADIVDGVFLDVRPIVDNDRKYIRLELEPQVVSLIPPPPDIRKIEFVAATTTTIAGAPQSSQSSGEVKRFIETPEREFQELKTSIVVPDGGTVLIGGLTGRVEGTARQEVPILSKIPILGSLFSRKVKGYQRRILIILVTAKIIVPEEKE